MSEDNKDRKKIISVTMTESLVGRVDELVKDRIGRSRAQLIEDAVRWYLDYTVHKWNERGIFWNSIRMIFASESMISLFFSKLTPADQYDFGITAGKQSPLTDIITLFYGKDITDKSSWDFVLDLLQSSGWGEMRIQNGIIVIGNPFYPPHFVQGYLSALLDVDLELLDTNVMDNIALRIKK